jgi:hypothetical protein
VVSVPSKEDDGGDRQPEQPDPHPDPFQQAHVWGGFSGFKVVDLRAEPSEDECGGKREHRVDAEDPSKCDCEDRHVGRYEEAGSGSQNQVHGVGVVYGLELHRDVVGLGGSPKP